MAKKVLWKDNTMPPTNYLWLKVNAIDEIEGLFEWNGKRWIKVASGAPGDGGSQGSGSSTPIKVVLLDGNTYDLTSFTVVSNGIVIMKAGDASIDLTTPDYVRNSVADVATDVAKDIAADAANDALFDEAVGENGNTIQVLKPALVEQITQQIGNNWINEE